MYTRLKSQLTAHPQFSHALRITLAIGFNLVFYHIFPLPHSVWGPVTTIVVMIQPHSGAITHKGLQRIGGTMLGASLGIITLFFPQQFSFLMPAWLLLWCFLLSLKSHGKNTYIFFLAAMTLIIVAYPGSSSEEMSMALYRVVNILIGSIIAIGFSTLFPIRAITAWNKLFAQNLSCLSQLYRAHISNTMPGVEALVPVKTKMIERHIKMVTLLANIQKEHRKGAAHYKTILIIQRSLISILEQLIETHYSSDLGRQKLLAQAELQDFQQKITTIFDQLLEHECDNIHKPSSLPLKEMAKAITKHEGEFTLGPYGYLWLTRQLVERLDQLGMQLKFIKW